MKTNSIKYKIFQCNLVIVVVLMVLIAIVFSVTFHVYIERETVAQLELITDRAVDLAVHQRPFMDQKLKLRNKRQPPRMPMREDIVENAPNNMNEVALYVMLNRTLKTPLSVLNAEYILLDQEKNIVTLYPDEYKESSGLSKQIVDTIGDISDQTKKAGHLRLKIEGTNYIAIARSLSKDNEPVSGYIIIYASLQTMHHLQWTINCILLIILLLSLVIMVLLSSRLSKKLSEPFVVLNDSIKAIEKRNFGKQIEMPVYDELSEMVQSFNGMSEKLAYYDKAEKTFLQNASHELRTPLMSIQSYAEGIKFDVVSSSTAADVILEESKRMTNLVEELLYLSRLESIEETYAYAKVELSTVISGSIDRIKVIAEKNEIQIQTNICKNIEVLVDEQKFSRAVVNIIGNCIRYARKTVFVEAVLGENERFEIRIWDDGVGFDASELPHVFERFYRGEKGNFGLGLAISKSIVEKHNGTIAAQNGENGGAVFTIQMPCAHLS